VLRHLEPRDISLFGRCSRKAFTYSNDESLWRALVLSKLSCQGLSIDVVRSVQYKPFVSSTGAEQMHHHSFRKVSHMFSFHKKGDALLEELYAALDPKSSASVANREELILKHASESLLKLRRGTPSVRDFRNRDSFTWKDRFKLLYSHPVFKQASSYGSPSVNRVSLFTRLVSSRVSTFSSSSVICSYLRSSSRIKPKR